MTDARTTVGLLLAGSALGSGLALEVAPVWPLALWSLTACVASSALLYSGRGA